MSREQIIGDKPPQQSIDELSAALDHFGATALAVKAERDQLREAMKGAAAIANQAGARIRQLEADNVRLKSALNDFITDIVTGRTEWETNGTVEDAKSIMGGTP
jgi:hypothetical protein